MSAKDQIIHITGFHNCPHFERAAELAKKLKEEKGDEVEIKIEETDRDTFHENRKKTLAKLGHNEDYHKTCPLVFTTVRNVPQQIIGGADAFTNLCKVEYHVGI